MKKTLIYLIFPLLFFSCKDKEEIEKPIPAAPLPAIPDIKLSNTRSVLLATYESVVKNEAIIGPVVYYRGLASATLRDQQGNVADGGSVSCDHQPLNYKSGSYVYVPKGDGLGIDFASSVSWAVSGKGNIPKIDYTYNRQVPKIGDHINGDSIILNELTWIGVDRENAFTNLAGADSIIYHLHGPSNSLRIPSSADVDSILLTAAELKPLGHGYGYIMTEAIHFEQVEIDGLQLIFANRGILRKKVFLD